MARRMECFLYDRICSCPISGFGVINERLSVQPNFDHEQTTRVFQNTMQPRYTRVSRSTLKRDAMKYGWRLNRRIIDSVGKLNVVSINNGCNHFPTENWVIIQSLTQLLEVFNTATEILSGVYYPTSPLVLQQIFFMSTDHLDAKERKQDKCPLETPLDFEEGVFDDEVQQNEAIPLSDEEIALDASSEGTMSPGGPRYDYMLSSEAEDDY
ncbi:hypothetical protein Tco_1311974 [Tanacetum coccineum]